MILILAVALSTRANSYNHPVVIISPFAGYTGEASSQPKNESILPIAMLVMYVSDL